MEDKFLWWEADSYSFIKLPKVLLESPKYTNLSGEAKILYSLMLDRMKLSTMNNWRDRNGYVYIYFTLNEACKTFHCGHDKAGKIFSELENAHLLIRQKQGLGRPMRLYVLKFFLPDIAKPEVQTSDNQNSALLNYSGHDFGNSDTINTENKKNDCIKNNLSICGYDATDVEQRIKEQIDFDILSQSCDKELLTGIVTLMVDTICASSQTVRIGDNEYAREAVRSRLLSLDSGHIEYVMNKLKDNTTKVRNPRAYMLTALFNAPASMNFYYTAEVNHDLYGT